MANIEHAVPNTPQTVFRLGSITKQFTAMAIVMLQEQGKLNVNDPICKHLAECPAAWQPITVKNLLTHTGGIANYTGFPNFGKTASLPVTNADMFALLKDKPLDFAVGEKYAYSNSGYFLLGTIIERASGKTYADFLQEKFLRRSDGQSGYDSPARIIKNRASGYAKQSGESSMPRIWICQFRMRRARCIRRPKICSPGIRLSTPRNSFAQIARRDFTPSKAITVRLSIGKKFDRNQISHAGNIYGFATDLIRFPRR